jgi:hypothetical protein
VVELCPGHIQSGQHSQLPANHLAALDEHSALAPSSSCCCKPPQINI